MFKIQFDTKKSVVVYVYLPQEWSWRWASKIATFEILLWIETDNLWSSPAPLLGKKRHMHPLTFLYKIESLTTFIWRNFWHNAYFLQRSAAKWIYFAFSYILIFQKWQLLEHPSYPLGGEDRHTHHGLFCTKLNPQQLLFEAFFDKYNAYFWQCRVLKWIYFAIFVHFN